MLSSAKEISSRSFLKQSQSFLFLDSSGRFFGRFRVPLLGLLGGIVGTVSREQWNCSVVGTVPLDQMGWDEVPPQQNQQQQALRH